MSTSPLPAPPPDESPSHRDPEVRHIDVRPDQVLQPDKRPWARLTLEGVVVRVVGLSAAVVATFLVGAALAAKLLRLW